VRFASTVRALLARTSRRTRLWFGLVFVVEVASRLLLVASAITVGGGKVVATAWVGFATAVVFALSRAAQAFARVGVQRDVYAATSRAVLEGDVLEVPTTDMRNIVLDGTHYATVLVGQLVPALAANVVASVVLVPVMMSLFVARVLVLAFVAAGVTLAAATALRAVAQRLEERSASAWRTLIDTLINGIENRLAIVAQATDEEHTRAFEADLARYEAWTRRAGIASALLGRAPLALGALAILVVVAVDAASRDALAGAIVTQAIVLAACFPPISGAILGALGSVRTLVYVAPLVRLLVAPPRGEVGRAGGRAVDLPAPVVADRLMFAYAEGSAPVLRSLSFAWPEREPLVLVGPNGAGKSTLLKLLVGLRPPTGGRLRLGNDELAGIDLRALREQVAYLPQRPYLGEPYASVREALLLGAREGSDEAMTTALERSGVLEALRSRSPDPLAMQVGALSAGQRQRVALARTLLRDARIVLLDEPDADLDREGVALVAALIRELCDAGKMVAVAAHSPELASLSSRPVRIEP
jgi:ABC-type bacteriocin/lantibiotic exporter with double-glycine peptidase domain